MTTEEHRVFRELWHAANELRIQVDLDPHKSRVFEELSDRVFQSLQASREVLEGYEITFGIIPAEEGSVKLTDS